MMGISREHRALVDYDQALRTPLALTRRIAVVSLRPGCGTTSTAVQVAAAFARRRSDGDVVVTDEGVRRDLASVQAVSSAVCLVARADQAAAAEALDALTALPDPGGTRVLALVESDPIGWPQRRRLRAITAVPTVLVDYQPALRLAERHRPSRLPYAYRIAHLRLAASLMADPCVLSPSTGSRQMASEEWSWDLPASSDQRKGNRP